MQWSLYITFCDFFPLDSSLTRNDFLECLPRSIWVTSSILAELIGGYHVRAIVLSHSWSHFDFLSPCRLTLGKNDYSELLMPSARVISPPNSRTRILCIRKHPRDKFGTHEQVHVTDVVDQRSWVALIVGMNQTQVPYLTVWMWHDVSMKAMTVFHVGMVESEGASFPRLKKLLPEFAVCGILHRFVAFFRYFHRFRAFWSRLADVEATLEVVRARCIGFCHKLNGIWDGIFPMVTRSDVKRQGVRE